MVHSILAWLHLGPNNSILDTVTWMKDDACRSPVKNGHWLLEATQCFNQLQVHTHVKLSSSSRKGMVLPGCSPAWGLPHHGRYLLAVFHALSIWKAALRAPFFHWIFLRASSELSHSPWQSEFALSFLALSDESLFECQCLYLLFFLATSTFTSSTSHTLFRSRFSCCTMTQVLWGPREPLNTTSPSLPCLHPSSPSKEHTDNPHGVLKPMLKLHPLESLPCHIFSLSLCLDVYQGDTSRPFSFWVH